jgi:hypothetical protein
MAAADNSAFREVCPTGLVTRLTIISEKDRWKEEAALAEKSD